MTAMSEHADAPAPSSSRPMASSFPKLKAQPAAAGAERGKVHWAGWCPAVLGHSSSSDPQ
eukprot:CAMPEP_0119096822 /NCGR_PEP_ID=MMETSP1178-20130426/174077_1 /TAXON_ID=33656 /ORGANISM="unid sp, Strain CCMP2000" /LENGTH=59 /DNA_ID=CAMNT_0007080727 /DNA_START=5 /DNA_END=181 /DNA_ORIENTATION=-